MTKKDERIKYLELQLRDETKKNRLLTGALRELIPELNETNRLIREIAEGMKK